ncbi:hypothetical protein [Plebeiibacterium sediminum]|uniref:Lipoprotein n=1 Tax=Plebeiibacterium sediminum TaxID=2992112 RepID=A0AAE3SFQ4_9BACT|nr:hypothetical protein [Plebeiobacterium sediminum]MCW3787337.1 hypothetical protein [Plebeiobacterium sediminum]
MKKSILLLVAVALFTSCAKESLNVEKEETEFVCNLGLKFVFLNELNQDLIEEANFKSYPITFKDSYSEISNDDLTKYQNEVYFNGNANVLSHDSYINKNVWETIVYGFDNISNYETYVHFQDNSVDTILVQYLFTTECLGRNYCAEIAKVFYNNNLIYSRENDAADYIFITKSGVDTAVELKYADE